MEYIVKCMAKGLGILLLAAILSGCGKEFDASGYVRGMLDIIFQNDKTLAFSMVEDPAAESLDTLHEESIWEFVDGNITNEIQMDANMERQFYDLCERMFATMRYQVGDAKAVGQGQYEVPVEIAPSDIFIRYQKALKEDAEKIAAAVQSGEYQGTEEEIWQQVLYDIIHHSYELLSVAYEEMEFGAEQTVVLTVKADENGEYFMEEEDIDGLIIKILRLDEILD